MTSNQLRKMLKNVRRVRVALLGDFCLDAYWFVDLSKSAPSLETGLMTRPIRSQRYSLGGAGNVVNNLRALGCKKVYALGVLGNDPWGFEVRRLLKEQGADIAGLLTQKRHWDTPVYIKPTLRGKEQSRFDGGNFNRLSTGVRRKILRKLRQIMSRVDVVLVNQQIKDGLHCAPLRRELARLIRKTPEKIFIVDSRDYGDTYGGAYLKLNDSEAERLHEMRKPRRGGVLREEAIRVAEKLYKKRGKPVFMTRGKAGGLVRDKTGLHEIIPIRIHSKIDTVGAGDSYLSGVSLALGAGYEPVLAAQLGHLAATVTIRKLHQTGTATPKEILRIAKMGLYEKRVSNHF